MNKRYRANVAICFILLFGFILPVSVEADPNFDFVFGNHIDTHQITELKAKDGVPEKLQGDFLIVFTEELYL